MKNNDVKRVAGTAVMLVVGAMSLSGCLGSPTYGTDQTAAEHLIDDLASATSINSQQGEGIVYRPRPGLVEPPNDDVLPPPQTSVASSEDWPESPEETRDRLRAQAELAGNGFQSPIAPQTGYTGSSDYPPIVGGRADGPPPPGSLDDPQSSERYRRAQELARVSGPTERRFLSEPPAEYRQPAETAAIGEFGESERAKQRRREQAAERAGTGGRRWWPF